MATPSRLRRAVEDLALLANVDVARLFRQIETIDELREALTDLLPGLIATYGDAAATVAADWYDDHREALGVTGRFTAIVPEPAPTGGKELARWGIGPLFGAQADRDAAETLVAGGLQRRIADAARNVVTGSSISDPFSDGWMRIGQGDNCPFCNLLIGRGEVYSETSVTFASHDHCNCMAAPAFGGLPRPVSLDESGVRLDASKRRDRSDPNQRADSNAGARDWIESHPDAG